MCEYKSVEVNVVAKQKYENKVTWHIEDSIFYEAHTALFKGNYGKYLLTGKLVFYNPH